MLVGHGPKQLLLGFDIEVFEYIGGECVGQDTENDDLLILRHVQNHLGHIRRRPFPKNFPEPAEITRVDQTPDLWLEDFPDHNDDEVKTISCAPPNFVTLASAKRNQGNGAME